MELPHPTTARFPARYSRLLCARCPTSPAWNVNDLLSVSQKMFLAGSGIASPDCPCTFYNLRDIAHMAREAGCSPYFVELDDSSLPLLFTLRFMSLAVPLYVLRTNRSPLSRQRFPLQACAHSGRRRMCVCCINGQDGKISPQTHRCRVRLGLVSTTVVTDRSHAG